METGEYIETNSNTHNGVSIVLCTYNGTTRLATTLKYIVAQKLSVPCELVVVDNASTDGTKQFVEAWWATNGCDAISFRIYEQPIPGKSHAQDLGYGKAKYELLLVCDDDNWLCDTYVQTAYDVMMENPLIGVLGGWSEAVFESEKPDWFDFYERYYAVGKQAAEAGDITESVGYLYGAGMVLRKSHWLVLKEKGFEHILTCRKGDSLSSGGDTEYCYAIHLLGYRLWYDERLYFEHYMTSGRLNLNYLSRLRKAMAYSNFVIMAYRDVLSGHFMTRKLQFKRLVYLLKSGFFKHAYRCFFGTYEQKEMGKNFFRKIYYLGCHYGAYLEILTATRSWLPKETNE